MDDAEVFGRIYQSDHWSGGSGEGSTVDAISPYLPLLARALKDARTVVDIGCGDWQFSQHVDWSGIDYLGIDVVPELIATNQERFGGSSVRFEVIDARRRRRLPRADLYIVKDVLQHWPNRDVVKFFRRARARALLVTNDVWSVHPQPGLNIDIPLGHWRTLDVERPPFSQRVKWHEDWDIRGEWRKRTALL